MTLGRGEKWPDGAGVGGGIDFKDTGKHSFQVGKSDRPDVASCPSPAAAVKRSGVTASPGPSHQSKKSLQLYHHLKYLFNNNNQKKTTPHRTIVKQHSQSVIIVIYNTKQLISSEI